ncbi:MAG: chorismate-binding protein [Planctomycetota bacterium]
MNVAIRTAEWASGQLRFGVGGGITIQSDPATEFEETVDKARGLGLALGIEKLR